MAEWLTLSWGGVPDHPHLGGGWANLPTPVISGRKCAMCAIFGINMQYNINFQKKAKIFEKSDDVIIFSGKTVKN